jgi:MFS family permease
MALGPDTVPPVVDPVTAAPPPARQWRARWFRNGAGLPRSFWVVWIGTVINRLGYVVEPFLALYLVRGRGVSVGVAGVLIACFGAGSLVSQPLGGMLADRVGRRATIIAGMTGSAAGFIALGLAPTLVAIGIAAAVCGLAIDLYRPAVAAIVADIVPSEYRARAFGLLYWGLNIGVGVAAVAGGFLAQHSYWFLFALDAATCLGFAIVVAVGLPETRPSGHSEEHGGYRAALSDGLLVALAGSALISGIVYMQSFVTLPLVMSIHGLGPAAYGLAYVVNPVAVIVLQPVTIRWLSKQRLVFVFVGGAVLLGLGFFLTLFARSVPAYAATVLVWTLGEIAFNAVGPALVADLAPAHLRGRYNGVFGTSFGAAALVAPIVGTLTLQHLGEGWLWSGCLLASVISGGAILLLGPRIEARRASMLEAAKALS